jgi:hypothetical protein
MLSEPIAVTLLVIEALDALGAPYVIGGSLASAVHGVARATMDSDLVADLRLEHVAPFTRALRNKFYLDEESIRDAIRSRRSFSVIHLEWSFKVDVFIPKQRVFDRLQLERRTMQIVATDPERTAYVATAEDTILAKLEWYRLGGEVSDRQWRDIMGILNVQRKQLDAGYMKRLATELQVNDLLQRALTQATDTDEA